ncbi:MAG: tetratricopeptide repeat protein [Bacteroidota bacterium]
MRFYLLIISFLIFFLSGFSQKKKGNEPSIPKNQQDSLKLEAVLIDAEKQLILENYAKALEGFTIALEMNSQSAAINFKLADVLSKSDEGQKAIPYGIKAIELDPENKYYWLGLARIYQSAGFYIEAAKVYEEMLLKFPSDENALYELAEIYQLTGRNEEMFKTFDRIEAELGVKEEIIREKQRIYMKQGKIDKVIIEYRKLINAYPNESSYKLEIISFLIQNKKLEEAEEEIKKYESVEKSNSRLILLKSEVAWLKGDYETSLTLLGQAFESPSIDFDSKFQIVSSFFMASSNSSNQKKLTDLARKLADSHPNEFKAQAFVGDMLYQDGRSKEAVHYYIKAARLDPSNYSIWQNILNVEAELNRYDSLVSHAEQALEYFPNQALIYYFAGTGYLIQKNYEKSIRMLERGKKYTVDPNLLTVFYGQLGDAYNGLGQTEKSFEAYEKALENKADNDHVLNNYSYFLSIEKQNLDKALQMSAMLVKMYPDNPTYLDTHGWVLYMRGDYKESKKFLEKAVSLNTEDGTILEHYGDVLFQLGDTKKAMEQWERALEKGEVSEFLEKKIADRKLYE